MTNTFVLLFFNSSDLSHLTPTLTMEADRQAFDQDDLRPDGQEDLVDQEAIRIIVPQRDPAHIFDWHIDNWDAVADRQDLATAIRYDDQPAAVLDDQEVLRRAERAIEERHRIAEKYKQKRRQAIIFSLVVNLLIAIPCSIYSAYKFKLFNFWLQFGLTFFVYYSGVCIGISFQVTPHFWIDVQEAFFHRLEPFVRV